jgi:hypothetical protein
MNELMFPKPIREEKVRKPLRARTPLKAKSFMKKATKPINKKSKLSQPRAKERAWDAFSIWVRSKNADSNGMVSCFTCGTVKPWREMQAGHFYHGTLDFNIYNVNVQCVRCNKWLHGNGVEYYPAMLRMYGQEIIDQLNELKHKVPKLKVADYLEIEKKYKEKINGLA